LLSFLTQLYHDVTLNTFAKFIDCNFAFYMHHDVLAFASAYMKRKLKFTFIIVSDFQISLPPQTWKKKQTQRKSTFLKYNNTSKHLSTCSVCHDITRKIFNYYVHCTVLYNKTTWIFKGDFRFFRRQNIFFTYGVQTCDLKHGKFVCFKILNSQIIEHNWNSGSISLAIFAVWVFYMDFPQSMWNPQFSEGRLENRAGNPVVFFFGSHVWSPYVNKKGFVNKKNRKSPSSVENPTIFLF